MNAKQAAELSKTVKDKQKLAEYSKILDKIKESAEEGRNYATLYIVQYVVTDSITIDDIITKTNREKLVENGYTIKELMLDSKRPCLKIEW